MTLFFGGFSRLNGTLNFSLGPLSTEKWGPFNRKDQGPGLKIKLLLSFKTVQSVTIPRFQWFLRSPLKNFKVNFFFENTSKTLFKSVNGHFRCFSLKKDKWTLFQVFLRSFLTYPLRWPGSQKKVPKNTIFHLFQNLFFRPIFERTFGVHFCVCPKNFLLIDRILIDSKKQKKFFIFAGFWTKTLFRVYFWGHVKNAIFWNGGQNFPLKFVNDGVEIFFLRFF